MGLKGNSCHKTEKSSRVSGEMCPGDQALVVVPPLTV